MSEFKDRYSTHEDYRLEHSHGIHITDELFNEAIEIALDVFGENNSLNRLVRESVDNLMKEELSIINEKIDACKKENYSLVKLINERSNNYNKLKINYDIVIKQRNKLLKLLKRKIYELDEINKQNSINNQELESLKIEKNKLKNLENMKDYSHFSIKELIERSEKLTALEFGGVDNWEWYDKSMEDYFKDKE